MQKQEGGLEAFGACLRVNVINVTASVESHTLCCTGVLVILTVERFW